MEKARALVGDGATSQTVKFFPTKVYPANI